MFWSCLYLVILLIDNDYDQVKLSNLWADFVHRVIYDAVDICGGFLFISCHDLDSGSKTDGFYRSWCPHSHHNLVKLSWALNGR